MKTIEVESICFDVKQSNDQKGCIKGEVAVDATNHAGERITMILKRDQILRLLK